MPTRFRHKRRSQPRIGHFLARFGACCQPKSTVGPWETRVLLMLVALLLVASSVLAADSPRIFLIGNSLTWDTSPALLGSNAQWHVDCGVSLQHIHTKPEAPCVKSSTLWPDAFRTSTYDVISVQPHYGTSLDQDVEIIGHWMTQQPKAAWVIHSGWAWHAKRAEEFESFASPTQMTHSPIYFRELVARLRAKFPMRVIRQTLAQNVLAAIAEDIQAGHSPYRNVAELYRDDIHVTHDQGKYLMHNVMRSALGLPPSTAGFEKVDADRRKYLDSVLHWLTISDADRELVRQALLLDASDRPAIVARIQDERLRQHTTDLIAKLSPLMAARREAIALEAAVHTAGGKVVWGSTAPQWLSLAVADEGIPLFDLPVTVDLYNGNNPLKGKGGKNEAVTDDWLAHLTRHPSLRRIDVSNCAIQGEGLKHLSALTGLRELNLTLTPVRDESLKHLAELKELRVLGLASTQCNGTGFLHLTGLQNLTSVNFHFTPLNDDGLRAIAAVPIADRLWFAHTRFTDTGATSLAQQNKLKRCGLGSQDPASSGEAVAALVKVPLEELALLDNQATPAGVGHAARIKTLRKLDVSHAPTVGDESLPALAAMSKLEELILGSAVVTDEGLKQLASSRSLKSLRLMGLKKVTPAGIEWLRKERPQWTIQVQ